MRPPPSPPPPSPQSPTPPSPPPGRRNRSSRGHLRMPIRAAAAGIHFVFGTHCTCQRIGSNKFWRRGYEAAAAAAAAAAVVVGLERSGAILIVIGAQVEQDLASRRQGRSRPGPRRRHDCSRSGRQSRQMRIPLELGLSCCLLTPSRVSTIAKISKTKLFFGLSAQESLIEFA